MGYRRARSYAAAGLLVIAVLYTLYLAQSLFVPIVVAMLLNLMLSPAVRRLHRWHVPHPIGALLVMAVLVGVLVLAVHTLWGPAASWANTLPARWDTVERKVRDLKQPLDKLRETTQEVEQLTDLDGEPDRRVQRVIPEKPSALKSLLGQSYQFLVATFVAFVLLFLLLATGESFMHKLVFVLPRLRDKKRAVRIVRTMENRITRYLITVTVINAALGTVVGVSLWLLGMPNPVLWGVAAFLLNYIPYAGPTVGIIAIGAVSLVTFEQPWAIAMPPLAYLAANIVEAYVVTPTVLGRSLSLSPAVVFLSVIMWSWLWGVVGAFIAVPLVVTIKVVCDAIEPLQPIGAFLGDRVTRDTMPPE